MKTKSVALIAFFLLFCLFAWSQTAARHSRAAATKSHAEEAPAAKEPSMETLNSFMHHMFGYDPNAKWKIESEKPVEGIPGLTEVVIAFGDPVQQRTPFYVTSDMHHALIGQIIPFGADPFEPARTKLAANAKGPEKGNPNAPVEIVEFSDFECPHCKRAMPTLDKLITESPNARFVFEQFPLSQIHHWADRAADYADCIGRKNADQFWKFEHAVFDQQEQITDDNAATKLSAIAQDVGADPSATATCADSPETKARVNQQYELGVSLGVNATPTLFINGRKIENVNGTPYEILKQMVAFEAQEAQKK